MKNPFRKIPMQQFETTIASLTKRGEQLVAKRVTAQDALDKAIKTRQQALLSGDLDDQRALDKMQAAVVAATSDLTGIDDALAVLAQHKAEAKSQLVAERECIERAAAADKLDKQVAAIEAALPGYLEQSRALADALSKIGDWHFESGQMAGFVQNTMGQLEIAANFSLAELKAMPDAIRQRRQAIPREPALMPVPAPEPPAPTMTVFMLGSARYRDHFGRKRFGGQWEDATMPVATAQRALRQGIAVPVTDPRRAQLRGGRGGDFNPDAPDVVDLDAVETAKDVLHVKSDPALREANFIVLDRSAEARTIQIDVSPT
jgi:hypothetical protein